MAASPDLSPAVVGVVTVSYRSGRVLSGFLASLPAATTGRCVHVVVDNAVEPDIEQVTVSSGGTYVAMPSNVGYGAAMNAGVAALPADIDWVLLSNPDVVLSPGVIDALVRVGSESPDVATVGPAVLNSDGSVYPSARAVPSLRTGVGHALFANLWQSNPWSAAYKSDHDAKPGRRDAGWLSGSCLLVRRRVFEEIGGFDPDFFMYFEDVDLGRRLGLLGYRNVYEPSVAITHTGAHSTTSESRRMVQVHHDSARRFLAKKYPGLLLWPVRAALTIGLAIRSRLVSRRLATEKG